MPPITLLIGIHNHQPVGNFDDVFEMAFRKCYQPVLDTLAEYPPVRFSIHHSGPLLDWMEQRQPRYLDLLAELVKRGQAEILGGGYYEPILTAIPRRDAIQQLEMMNSACERRFGVRPRGFWLAERVWDPAVPELAAAAGLTYTILDDTHFIASGLDPARLDGHYITDKAGSPLAVFPISKNLRYRIPFWRAGEVMDYLAAEAERGVPAAIYADDGEKFGLWPDTFEWVQEKGWLRQFCEALCRNTDTVRTGSFGDWFASHAPRGRAYLPTASYMEMMEWALPTPAARAFATRRHELEELGEAGETDLRFMRGGVWENFLARYPESNRIHKLMVLVSEKLDDAERNLKSGVWRPDGAQNTTRILDEARAHLFRGQCNCAYWHGMFGGLYLVHLRHALIHHILRAWELLDSLHSSQQPRCYPIDLRRDFQQQIALESDRLFIAADPADGGAVHDILHKHWRHNLANVLTRREEAYHHLVASAVVTDRGKARRNGEDPAIATIHERVRAREAGLENLLTYDPVMRASFRDWLVPEKSSPAALERYEGLDAGHASAKMEVRWLHGEAGAILTHPEGGFTKTFVLSDPGRLQARYEDSRSPPDGFLRAVEFNLTLLSSADPRRQMILPGDSRHDMNQRLDTPAAPFVLLRDEYEGYQARLSFDPPPRLVVYPIETVAQSEDGFERSYQGACLMAIFPAGPSVHTRLITLDIEPLGQHP
ncbi:MAG: Alpha-amylase 1 [Myxococcota bacterium]|nr:Alpha-amylase 1 [Myxococcota bacterium]